MKGYTDQLWVDTNRDGTLQPAPTDGGLLPRVKQQRPQEWTTNDITPGEGSEFNARLCGEYGGSNTDNSKGVHNPFLCEALLTASISYVKTYYGLSSETATKQALLERPVGRAVGHATRTARPHSGQ